MTVSTTTARNVKTCNGVTTSFPFDFAFEVEGDLIVNRVVITSGVETLQVLTTDYTVTGGSGATGTIEMVSAPPSTDNLVIERDLAYTQGTDYQPNDPFPAEVNETALDRLTFLVQQVLAFVQRAILLPKNTTLTDITFPIPVALKTFRWNAAATALEETDDPAVSATAAATSATNAATSEANAATSETAASSSASAAATSASNASTSETNAATSETNASTSETNAAASAVTADSAAQAVAERYDFDASIVMGDPGTGDVRYNNATVSSVTQIAVSANTAAAGAPDISARIVTWDDSTNSALRGTLVIRKGGTPATFAVFSITGAITDNGTWLQIPVTHVASAGAWSAADDMYVEFTRTGDVGGGLTDVVDDTSPQLGGALDTNSFAIDESEGTNVASGSSTNVWVTNGNTVHITGVATINDFATAPRVGATRRCIADGAFTLADSATIIVPGNANFTVAVDATFEVYAETTTTFRIRNLQKADGTAVVSSGPNAACQLTKSGANLLLSRHNGTTVNIDGTLETIPSGGVTLAATGAVVDTLYFIYAFMSGSTMTLERSTTGHSTDTATGMEIKTADSTRTLVGMARPITGPAWADTLAQRFVRSWFNDPGVLLESAQINGDTTTSTPYVDLDSAKHAEWLNWLNEAVLLFYTGNMENATTLVRTTAAIGVDGITPAGTETAFDPAEAAGRGAIACSVTEAALSEGFHDARVIVKVASSTGTYRQSAITGKVGGR